MVVFVIGLAASQQMIVTEFNRQPRLYRPTSEMLAKGTLATTRRKGREFYQRSIRGLRPAKVIAEAGVPVHFVEARVAGHDEAVGLV